MSLRQSAQVQKEDIKTNHYVSSVADLLFSQLPQFCIVDMPYCCWACRSTWRLLFFWDEVWLLSLSKHMTS